MNAKSKAISPVLTAHCTFPEVFQGQGSDENRLTKQSESEVAYSRSDYNGYRWWTTWRDCQKEKPSDELVQEIDGFHNALFAMPEFGNLDTLRRLCDTAERTNDPTEFNLYSETEHFHVWLRLIPRVRDYNLYVHYYRKQDS